MSSGGDEQLLSRGEAWALVACQPLAQLSNMALLPSLGAMRADLDLTYAELGSVVAAFGVARLLVDLPAGNLANRWNPRVLLIAAFALSAAASSLGVLAANAWQIATVRLLIGAGSSVAQAMILAWLVGGAGRAGRGRVMARSEAFFSLSGLFIPALGGLLAGSLGWRVAFVLGALAAFIGLVAIAGGTRSSSAARAVGQATHRTTPTSPTSVGWRDLRAGGSVLLASYLATFVVFYCRNGMLNAVLPVLGTEALGIEPSRIGLLFSAINAVGIGAVLLGGRWGDRFGRYRVMVPALALLALAQALMLTIVDPLTYALVGVMQGVAAFVNPIPTTVMGDALPPHMRARGIAVYRTVCDVAILSAPGSMGLALQVGGFAAAEVVNLSVSVVVLLACAALYWRHASEVRQYST